MPYVFMSWAPARYQSRPALRPRHALRALPPRFTKLPSRIVGRLVTHMTQEMAANAGLRVPMRSERRRYLVHIRQISMYVCHVELQLPMHEVGRAFGRDRTTVSHACQVVEDRRDDPAYDAFVSGIERMATSIIRAMGGR